MKDIDFDELDRAVNSLMSGVPKADSPKEEDESTLALDSGATSSEILPEHTSTQVLAATADKVHDEGPTHDIVVNSSSSTTSTPAPLASRRRGQFMDMVRPGAPESRKPVPSRPTSRNGATIQPSGANAQSGTPSTFVAPAAPRLEPHKIDSSQSSDWPDPLENVDFNETTKAVSERPTRTEPVARRESFRTADSDTQDTTAPMASPFLPDTKVEKRPLGRQSDEDIMPQDRDSHGDDDALMPANGSAPDMASREVKGAEMPRKPLPAELGSDVMAIEADTSSLPVDTSEPRPSEQKSSSYQAAPRDTARPVATSIPQQYKVHPQVAEQTAGAIYDTASYHQPLSHPAKKKHDWLWVFIIIIILILGAASGAAVYFGII